MDSPGRSNEELLASALRSEAGIGPAGRDRPAAIAELVDAAFYHGVAGLLVAQREVMRSWPGELVEALTVQARAQAMWEMRHREALSTLLAAFKSQGIPTLLMKGTAIAYDLYSNPSARSRGDTDLLIAARDRRKAGRLLASLGYAEGVVGGVDATHALQQPWTLSFPDGSSHSIDLHWQVMNAPSLEHLLTFYECHADARPLERLSPDARAMDRVRLLIHTCLHRAVHCNTPYFVDGTAHYGSGRLIWSYDIHLLASAFDDGQWAQFRTLAKQKGVAGICLDGLLHASTSLGTQIPRDVQTDLESSAGKDRRNAYLVRSRAISRAWQDIRAIPGLASKFRYARARILPDSRFIRAKYPNMTNASLPLLFARRLLSLVRAPGGRLRH